MGRPRPDVAARNRAGFKPDAAFRLHPSEYNIWRGMKTRCHVETSKDYERYGARGISVCERWRDSFEAFFADMGPRPSGRHQIDRKDNDGNYEPGNCRWATPRENALNKRSTRMISCFGEMLPLSRWAERTGICRVLIMHRLRNGWSTEEALTARPSRSLNSRHRRTKEVCT